MDKIFIKPISKEITIKGANKEGGVDLFSYNFDSDQSKKRLGNLYLVGNVQDASVSGKDNSELDAAYIINLIASLAKREYYAYKGDNPKESFSNTLKKINDVVEEFFKNQNLKINVGIFAIAGENIFISKLGKFKILLARDNKDIDVLNNINLFDKEHVEEREFSSIISGKISEGDKILAFYPNRSLVAREKSLKEGFVKNSQDSFVTFLDEIKTNKPDFACAAIHINVKKTKETAVMPKPQPHELKKSKPVVPYVEAPEVILTEDKATQSEEQLQKKPVVEPALQNEEPAEPPRIISSEFSLGKKESNLVKKIKRFKAGNLYSRHKNIVFGASIAVVVISVLIVKSFIIVNPEQKQLNTTISEAQNNLKMAETKISQNDIVGARSLLFGSIADLIQKENSNPSSSLDSVKNDLVDALDKIDNIQESSPVLVYELPQSYGDAGLVTINSDSFFTYSTLKDGPSYLIKISSNNFQNKYDIADIDPTMIFGNDTYVSLVDTANKKLAALSISKGSTKNYNLSLDSLISADIYESNLYALTDSTITKITDAVTGSSKAQTWLQNGTSLPANPVHMVVDGDVYVMSTDGKLTVYYKGLKKKEMNTSIITSSGDILLTTKDSLNLYLVNKELGRIYIISKDTGNLVKAIKTGTNDILSAALNSQEQLYILSKDNKIWQVPSK